MRILETFNLSFVQMLNEHDMFKDIHIIYCYNGKSVTANYESGQYGYTRSEDPYYSSRDIQILIKR